jgi:hypothetical protein
MFFLILFGLSSLIGIVYVVWVEATVRLAAWELRKDMEQVTIWAAQQNKNHIQQCAERLESEEIEGKQLPAPGAPLYPIQGYQMRFISQDSYVLELVCNRKPVRILELDEGKLTRGLTKTNGSGILVPVRKETEGYDDLTGLVAVKFGYRTLGVGVISGSLGWRVEQGDGNIDEGLSVPNTTCAGWGSFCCSTVLEMGEGSLEPRAIDCPETCFSHCGQRPVLVFFNTSPLLDYTTRTLTLFGNSVEVTFGYEVNDADNAVQQVVIEYGDGTRYETSQEKGLVTHTYRCATGECRFDASIAATDVLGYTLGDSRNTVITVIMKASQP